MIKQKIDICPPPKDMLDETTDVQPKILHGSSRTEWRMWLSEHFESEKSVWLVFPNKSSNKPRISYNDAVEEALCFGWIDSNVKSYIEDSHIQHFTPRKPKSTYSQPNRERLRWLEKENLLHPSVKAAIKGVLEESFVFPEDILQAIRSDAAAWENYSRYSPSYQRIRVAYIAGARSRPEEFQKRLANFIQKAHNNKVIGYGGIEKHY